MALVRVGRCVAPAGLVATARRDVDAVGLGADASRTRVEAVALKVLAALRGLSGGCGLTAFAHINPSIDSRPHDRSGLPDADCEGYVCRYASWHLCIDDIWDVWMYGCVHCCSTETRLSLLTQARQAAGTVGGGARDDDDDEDALPVRLPPPPTPPPPVVGVVNPSATVSGEPPLDTDIGGSGLKESMAQRATGNRFVGEILSRVNGKKVSLTVRRKERTAFNNGDGKNAKSASESRRQSVHPGLVARPRTHKHRDGGRLVGNVAGRPGGRPGYQSGNRGAWAGLPRSSRVGESAQCWAADLGSACLVGWVVGGLS